MADPAPDNELVRMTSSIDLALRRQREREGSLGRIRPLAPKAANKRTIAKIERRFSIPHLFSLSESSDTTALIPAPEKDYMPDIPDMRTEAQKVLELFRSAEADEALTLKDMEPYRLPAVTRIVREMARHRSLVKVTESMAESLGDFGGAADPWLVPRQFTRPYTQDAYTRTISARVVATMLKAEKTVTEYLDYETDPPQVKEVPGVPLFPPPVPRRFIDPLTGEPTDDYNPYKDTALLAYLDVLDATIDYLGVTNDLPEHPDSGRYATAGLLDPEIMRMAFPSKFQIVATEQFIVEGFLREVSKDGAFKARRKAKATLLMHDHEIDAIHRLAGQYARHLGDMEIDDHRALMAMRLDDFISRAQSNLDLRAELMALKTIAVIQGLSKSEADDTMKDIVDAVKKVSSDRQSKALANDLPQILSLPSEEYGEFDE